MYVAPSLTDLGSFQELTLGASLHTGVIGVAGSLATGAVHTVVETGAVVVNNIPGITLDDNSGMDGETIILDPSLTVEDPR